MEEPRRLGGRYELGGVLGRGGMAEVYIAHDTRLGRTVAVKTLRTDLASDPTFQARFRREAQSAASLNHPAIVAVYDTGEDYVDGISIPYIVMEYVEGSTLRELLHSGRKLLPERSLEMTIGILQALEYSHRSGIVHRDIKPANVMLTRNGQVKVMDFGIARAMGDAGMTMTQTAAVIGTAQYLSPEQAKGEQVDARSDLYSTGCLLYELLTVRPPFVGDSPVAVAYQHVREEPQPPSVYDPEVTPAMDAIVLKALAKNREDRYQSADEMRADIERALDGLPVAAAMPAGAGAYAGDGGYSEAATTAMPAHGGAAPTSMLPPMREDDGGYGYDEPSRAGRRQQQKKSNTSTILLVAAAVVVLILSIFLGKELFSGGSGSDDSVVPNLKGKTFTEAERSVKNVGLLVEKGGTEFCDEPVDAVCSQDPEKGTKLAEGETVTVKMSKGEAPVEVPDVVGDKIDEAEQELKDAGFEVTQKQEVADEEPGTVLRQSPDGGETAKKGSTIRLVVAKEEDRVGVPDVIGRTQADAEAQIKGAGLTPAIGEPIETADQAEGTVVQQSPAGNQQVAPGSTVTLRLAKAPATQAMPGLTGQPVKQAEDALKALNLDLQIQISGDNSDKAVVAGTNPPAGTPLKKGDTVVLQTVKIDGGGDGGVIFGQGSDWND
ncbi:Stk1 family PASTA domain-containing Ser/Thr kinase [Streptomyces sp. SCUT-3]|uniref:Stk1 family PASTA domain-containing Ser/Thr kinase n=1 Tax=Streptomyces sp. SCUT-3 TaxID=2684469 RepID=UPI000CAA86E9|nr:Stk1 family PASTA domain-containing Ser/Thr kinase [Streptomyces sp. SCUT-3]PLW66039.1 serine/threonine protein kinase [Streptomyces sp. DJ]QMV22485.1 Stk1 family PASTA domain-containing Ser/Thr kinase [Streptomyces sp. SCUT-3]